MTISTEDSPDDGDDRNDLWSVRNGIIERAKQILDNMDPYMRVHQPTYGSFVYEPFERLSANDRAHVLQRVRGKRLDGPYAPYCVFWLPDEKAFAVATSYPLLATETPTGDETLDRVLVYIRGEITGSEGSFRNGGVLVLRDLVDDHDPERIAEFFDRLDDQTHEVGDGSNATFTLKSHRRHGQVEVRLAGQLAPI